MINNNAETVRKLLQPREDKIRLYQSTPSGPQVYPSLTSFLLPAFVPADLVGLVSIDTFDLKGRPLRRKVDAYLPGRESVVSEPNAQITDSQIATGKPPEAAHGKLPQPAHGKPPHRARGKPTQTAVRTSLRPLDDLRGRTQAGSRAQSTNTTPPSSPLPSPPSETPPKSAQNLEPDLAREMTLAQIQQLRSRTQREEAAANSEIERGRMSLIQSSTYTTEIGEWQQLSSFTHQDLHRGVQRTQELTQRQIEQADYAARRMHKSTKKSLRLYKKIAKLLKSEAFRVPPPPQPQVDSGAIAISLMNMLSNFATAFSSGATPNPQVLSALAGLAASAAPVAPAAPAVPAAPVAPVAPARPAAPVAPLPPARPAAPATPASKTVEGPTIVLTKERLLALTAKNALGVAGNSETLAALIRADRLHLALGGIDPPVHGVYKIRKSTLIQLAADGVLTLFGDSEGFRCLVESGRFEELLRTEQGEPQGTT